MRIVLHQPRIPPNTGNAIRLCVNIGATLDLIHPLGFSLSDRHLRRAGLDYRERAVIHEWPDYAAWRDAHPGIRVFAATKHGDTRYDTVAYRADDALLFGSETEGLPQHLIAAADAGLPSAAGQPQSEPVQQRGGDRLRGLAPATLRRTAPRRDPRGRTAPPSPRRRRPPTGAGPAARPRPRRLRGTDRYR